MVLLIAERNATMKPTTLLVVPRSVTVLQFIIKCMILSPSFLVTSKHLYSPMMKIFQGAEIPQFAAFIVG